MSQKFIHLYPQNTESPPAMAINLDGVVNGQTLSYNSVTGAFEVGTPSSGLSSTLTSAHLFVGSAGNVATDVAITGGISITNAGVVTLVAPGSTTQLIINSANAFAGIPVTYSANVLTIPSSVGITSPGTGPNSEKYGSTASAAGASSVVLGNGASSDASASNSVVIGTSASVAGQTNSIAIGNACTVQAPSSVAIGAGTTIGVTGNGNIVAVGANITAANLKAWCTAIGDSAKCRGPATFPRSVAVGKDSDVNGNDATAIGGAATVAANGGTALGDGTSVGGTHTNSTAVGVGATTTAANQIRLGTAAETVSMPNTCTVSGVITASSGVAFGGGSTITKTITATAALNFPSTAAQNSSDLTITATGAALGDTVILGVPDGATLTNSNFTAWVSAADTVKVRFNNYSAGALDPASGTFKVIVVQ